MKEGFVYDRVKKSQIKVSAFIVNKYFRGDDDIDTINLLR